MEVRGGGGERHSIHISQCITVHVAVLSWNSVVLAMLLCDVMSKPPEKEHLSLREIIVQSFGLTAVTFTRWACWVHLTEWKEKGVVYITAFCVAQVPVVANMWPSPMQQVLCCSCQSALGSEIVTAGWSGWFFFLSSELHSLGFKLWSSYIFI